MNQLEQFFTWSVVIFFSVWLVSCNAQLDSPAESYDIDSSLPSSKYYIPIQEALANLDQFIKSTGKTGTYMAPKSSHISQCISLGGDKRTRAQSDSLNPDLIYIANFENGEGFAILSADKRIGTAILGLASEGNVNLDDIYEREATRTLYAEYPISGPGFLKIENPKGTEWFVNPNTVRYGNKIKGDTLVGALYTKGLTPTGETCDSIIPQNKGVSKLLVDLSLEYADRQMKIFKAINSEDENGDDGDDDSGDGAGHDHSGDKPDMPNANEKDPHGGINVDPGSGGGGDKDKYEEKKPSLLGYRYWNQKRDLNVMFPMKRKYHSLDSMEQAPVGSFSIALSKIMAKLHFPESYSALGSIVSWENVRAASIKGWDDACRLVRSVADGMGSQYFYNVTLAYPSAVIDFMSNLGFQEVKLEEYDFDIVKSMLKRGCPVLIFSMTDEYIEESHAWNIDGYKVNLSDPSEKPMVHCDFGMAGVYNGYYISGLFDSSDGYSYYDSYPPLDKDNPENGTFSDDTGIKFSKNIRVITYQKP